MYMFDFLAIVDASRFESLLQIVAEWQYVIAVLAPLSIGEPAIHVFGVLYGAGEIAIFPFLIALGGSIITETLVYVFAGYLERHHDLSNRARRTPFLVRAARVFINYERQFRGHLLLLLFVMKVVPLTKFAVFLFALRYKLSFWGFLVRNTIVTTIWGLFIFIPGWLVGKEFLSQASGMRFVNFILYFLLLIISLALFGRHFERFFVFLAKKVMRFFEERKKR